MQRPTRKQTSNTNGIVSIPSGTAPSHKSKSSKSSSSPAPSLLQAILPKRAIGSVIVLIVGTVLFFSSSRLGIDDDSTEAARRSVPNPSSSSSHGNSPLLRTTTSLSSNDLPLLTSPATNAVLHVVFSTDCSTFQHWQSYLFFHAAYKISQPGYVTRIASGCDDEQIKSVQRWHDDHIKTVMSERYRIHFTPHFSGVKDETTGEVKGDYKYFNKPFGLKHFLERSEFMGIVGDAATATADTDTAANGEKYVMRHPDAVVILCDPDFLLLRPITDDFSNERETIISARRKQRILQNNNNNDTKKKLIVSHGKPFAQTYGLGTQWRKFDIGAIAGEDSPAKDMDQTDGQLHYPVGPPYIGTAEDMYKIANAWSEFAPRVHAEYPHLLAEMYAYCIAAAHLKLPHTLIDSLMVSSAGVGGEGWGFVDKIPSDRICPFAARPDHSAHPLPSVIHYCQRYAVDRYFWGKRKMPHDIFTCEHPLLIEPPMDVGSGKYLQVTEGANKKEISADKEKMDGFVLCALTAATNDAMTYYKDKHCDGGANREKTYDMRADRVVHFK